jgi:hypothetical protein
MNSTIIGKTGFSTGNSIEKPTRLILKTEEDGFVSRFQTNDDMEFTGHYYKCSLEDAKAKFENRVKLHNEDYKKGNASHLGDIEWC